MYNSNIMSNRKYNIRLFLIYLLILAFTTVAIAALFLQFDRYNKIKNIKEKSRIQLEYQKNLMLSHFDNIRSDILFLPQLNELLSYREFNNEAERVLIENEFYEFTKSRKVYDQIRYIDERGQEVVRINYNRGDPVVVSRDLLQNKSDRYYFSETMSCKYKGIYISPFDLNMELDHIEEPFKPMIRFATPVFDSQNIKKGIIILNYLGNTLLEDLHDATLNEPGSFSLLNTDGFWIFNIDREEEWGFMFHERRDHNYAIQSPEIWEQISNHSFNQIMTGTSLITSMTISPFPETDEESDESWILLNTISCEEIGVNWFLILKNLRFIGLFILFIDIILAYILSKIVIQRNKLQDELKELALYDPLTNLPNRRYLYEQINTNIIQSQRYEYTFALIYIDLDGFKAVNDSLGHKAGDQLLKMVALRLIDSVRTSDIVSRIGGDEFVILLTQVQNAENCSILARKILKNLSIEYDLHEGIAEIQGSLGIKISKPPHDDSVEELLKKADSAMYEVKVSGKNDFRISTE